MQQEKDRLLGSANGYEMPGKPLAYRNGQHMSSSAFESLLAGLEKQRASAAQLSRSISAHDVNQKSLDPRIKHYLQNLQRKCLYETLPFVAAHGMQHREQKIRRVLSTASMQSLEDLQGVCEVNMKYMSYSNGDIDLFIYFYIVAFLL